MSTAPSTNLEAIFYQQYESVRRDEVVGVLLALFLGTFGAHHFYLRRVGLGLLYLAFFWTGFPALLGFIECFFMPGRVREFNAIQAAAIAASLGITMPAGWVAPINVNVYTQTASAQPAAGAAISVPDTLLACPRCQATNPGGSRFCGTCGATL